MKTTFFKFIPVLFLITAISSFEIPEGWSPDGNNYENYEMGIESGAGYNGKTAATIKSILKIDDPDSFGTLMQNSTPQKYLGGKIKMAGYLKTENVKGGAGLWLRVDSENPKEVLSFYNMDDKNITGNTEWTKYEIILDVPENASNLAYGGLLVGSGQIWFDDIKFEAVDNPNFQGEPVYTEEDKIFQTLPANLDFENN